MAVVVWRVVGVVVWGIVGVVVVGVVVWGVAGVFWSKWDVFITVWVDTRRGLVPCA